MKYVYLALNWFFGVLFLLIGIVILFGVPSHGLSFILISLLLLPPFRNFVYLITKKKLSVKIRSISILVLFIALGYFNYQYREQERVTQELIAQKAQEKAEKVAAIRQQNLDYFNENSTKILNQLKMALGNSDYKGVVSLSEKYLPSKNKELMDLQEKAKSGLIAIAKAEEEAKVKEKTKEILAKLKKIPVSQYETNLALYKELVAYNPNDDKYKNKLSFYSVKVKEAKEKLRIKEEKSRNEREAKLAKFGKAPVQSPWDGSYREVERYLERYANDPDSIEIDNCTPVSQNKNGWQVGCNYRGRNAFGGMVRQFSWFTIVHGMVIEKH
ncbi:hypothetical protein AU255_11680 [Methyloprofundus sedimenti]|uniref:Uncharacterized protein n=1 Tax=Methyloprofundus sedimenti TaxID=1420851 RepID=A0A1V8MAU7_9GAMM|nr:hypothetical protein [Methyloprofundus sedimenti]OQK18443.1 hypothetical protein AU255_11680 [Methyloprofundus sedimenti]